MNVADYIIIIVLALSVGLALFRGFVIEALSLVTWVASFVIARLFSTPLSGLLVDWVEMPSARQPIAFVILVVVTLIIGALVKILVKKMVEASGLSGLDRALGSVFGLFRGCLLVVIALAVLSRITEMPQDPWWKASVLIPHFMVVEEWTADAGQQVWQKLMSVNSSS